MNDIDYHSIYTQFVTEKCKDSRPPAIVTSGILQKIEEPYTKINLYHIVPTTIAPKTLECLRINSINPHIQSMKLIKHVDTFVDPSIKCEIIPYKTRSAITYTDIFKSFDPTSINILLYDAVVLDQVWTDYLGHVIPNTLGVLSSKKLKEPVPADPLVFNDFSEYTYQIDNFNGFIVFGRPNIDLPYYPNVFGSRHMLIKKCYASKYNIVNLANIIPCYMFEANPDYSSVDTYIHAPSFSIMIVTPQVQTIDTDIVIDEEDIFKDRNTIPVDSTVTFEDVQTDLSTYIPFIEQLGFATFEKAVRANFYSKLQKEYSLKLSQFSELFEKRVADIEIQLQDVKINRELQLENELTQKSKEIVQKYAAIEKKIVEDLEEVKNRKVQDIEKTVTTECELIRAKKMVEIDAQTKTLFDELEVQYSQRLAEKHKLVTEYETHKKLEVDEEISKIRERKIADVETGISDMKQKLENSIDDMRKQIEDKLSTEIRTEYIKKYNDEYLKSLIHMNQKIEERQNFVIHEVDMEADAYKQKKFKEIEVWERLQRNRALALLIDYEAIQKKKIADASLKYKESEFAKIDMQVKHRMEKEFAEKKRQLDETIEKLRIEETQKVNKEAAEFLKEVVKNADAESNVIRNDLVKNIEEELNSQKMEIKKKIEDSERVLMDEMKKRVDENEEKYIEKLLREREEIVNEKLASIQKMKEAELQKEFVSKYNEKYADHVKQFGELDKKLQEKKSDIDSEIRKLKEQIDSEISEKRKQALEKYQREDEFLREELVQSRKLFAESEYFKLKENMIRQLEDERRTEYTKIREAHEKEVKMMEEHASLRITSDKQQKELELDSWYNKRKNEIESLIAKEYFHKEEQIKEAYELKRCEFAETFAREVEELEKARINYHSREQSRMSIELLHAKEQALASINIDVEKAKQDILDKIKLDCEDYRKKKLQEVDEKITSEMKGIIEEKTRKLESEIEPSAQENVRNRISELEKSQKEELEKFIENERVSHLKKINEDAQSMRSSLLSEIRNEIETIKDSMKLGMMDVLNAEMQNIRQQKIAEVETLKEQMIRDAELQVQENERRRKAKIKEMEDLLLKFK